MKTPKGNDWIESGRQPFQGRKKTPSKEVKAFSPDPQRKSREASGYLLVIMRFCAIVFLICLFTTTRYVPAQEKSPFVFSWPRETALLTTGVAAQTLGRYRVNHMRPAGPE